MVNRFVIPVIEARRAEGRAEGRAEVQAQWQKWNRRRLDAEAQGQPLVGPPPGGWSDDDDDQEVELPPRRERDDKRF